MKLPPSHDSYEIVLTKDGHLIELEEYSDFDTSYNSKSPTMHNKKKETAKLQKRVSFDAIVVFTETIHYNEYTKKERLQSWYNRNDLRRIREEYISTIRLFSQAGKMQPLDDEHHCVRGLEHHLSEKNKATRKQSKSIARSSVLHEQSIQFYLGRRDANMIAARYLPISKYCSLEAYDLGLMDEIAVFNEQ
mmetsp:Transcript_3425/g.5107  ORF Transcript_3425/g.5107 Transcript_3425/m.5107 type:complete len:191 (-) Transcript_3425:306-878(-)